MASRVFSTKKVLSFVVDNEEPVYDDLNEPIVDGSNEEFECTEGDLESGDEGESAEEDIESVEENLECVETDMYGKYDNNFI